MLIHNKYTPCFTFIFIRTSLPTRKIVYPGKGIVEGHTNIWMEWDKTGRGGGQASRFISTICLMGDRRDDALHLLMLFVLSQGGGQGSQRLCTVAFIGDGGDDVLSLLPDA